MSNRGTRKTTEEFIAQSKEVHGTSFDYSNVEYVNTHTKVSIVCNTCKNTIDQAPMCHLKGNGCRFCSNKGSKSQETFISEARDILGPEFDLSEVKYVDTFTKVRIKCPKHGWFEKVPKTLLKDKKACQKCGAEILIKLGAARRSTTERFISKAIEIHGTKYDYSHTVYTVGRNPVIIICPIHGPFHQAPDSHITQKSGCGVCGHLRSFGLGGYSLARLQTNPELCDIPTYFYIVKLSYDNDTCIKIGITTKPEISDRFNKTEYKDFDIVYLNKVLTTMHGALTLENNLLTQLSKYKFFTNRKFSGYTECLKYNPEVIDAITDGMARQTSAQ